MERKVFALRCQLLLHLEQSHRPALQLLPSNPPSQLQQVDFFMVHSKGKTKMGETTATTGLGLT